MWPSLKRLTSLNGLYTKASHKEQCVSVIVLIQDQWGLVLKYEIHMESLYWTHTDMLICAVYYSLDVFSWIAAHFMCCVCLTQVNREEQGYKGRLVSVSSSQSNASSGFSEEKEEISEEDSGELTSHAWCHLNDQCATNHKTCWTVRQSFPDTIIIIYSYSYYYLFWSKKTKKM